MSITNHKVAGVFKTAGIPTDGLAPVCTVYNLTLGKEMVVDQEMQGIGRGAYVYTYEDFNPFNAQYLESGYASMAFVADIASGGGGAQFDVEALAEILNKKMKGVELSQPAQAQVDSFADLPKDQVDVIQLASQLKAVGDSIERQALSAIKNITREHKAMTNKIGTPKVSVTTEKVNVVNESVDLSQIAEFIDSKNKKLETSLKKAFSSHAITVINGLKALRNLVK